MFNPELFAKLKARTVEDAAGCWVWQGPVRTDPRWKKGEGRYGIASYWDKEAKRQRSFTAHRAMWRAMTGEVFFGRTKFVCHTCDNGLCINPDHLYVGTPQDNMDDAVARKRFPQQQVTHCRRGHEYTPENTRVVTRKRNGAPQRQCKACHLINWRIRAGWPADVAASTPSQSRRSTSLPTEVVK
jgi:HNH endonuclease